MPEKYNIKRIAEIKDRKVFVDANVLIYLNWATGSERNEESYSAVYLELLKQGNKLFVDFLVISEVINRIFRIEHKKLQSAMEYKQFRDSKQGKTVLSDIYSIVENRILENFHVVKKSFSEDDIRNFLTVDSLDFMDKGIWKICKENNFVLLTNDKDYKNSNLDVLSCNRQVLTCK